MKLEQLLEAYTSLRFIGINLPEMGGIIEKSAPADVGDVIKRIHPDHRAALVLNVHNILEAGNYNYIWWLHDETAEVHYFFEE